MGSGSVVGVPFVARTKALECLGRTRRNPFGNKMNSAIGISQGTDWWSLVKRKMKGWANNDAASLFHAGLQQNTATAGNRPTPLNAAALHDKRQAAVADGMRKAAWLPLLSGVEASTLADTMAGAGGSRSAASWARPWMVACSSDGQFLLSCMHWDHSFRVSAIAEGMPSVCVVTGHDGPVTCLHVCPRPVPAAEVGSVASIHRAPSASAARSIVSILQADPHLGSTRACGDVAAAVVNAGGLLSGASLHPSRITVQAAATAALAAGSDLESDLGDGLVSMEGREGAHLAAVNDVSSSDAVRRAMARLLDPRDQWSMPTVNPDLLQRTAERLDLAAAQFRSAPQLPVVTPVAKDGWSGEDVVTTGSSDGTVRVWRMWQGRISPQPRLVLSGHEDTITCVHACAHFDVVASCSADGSVLLHSLSTGRLIRSIVPEWVESRVAPAPGVFESDDSVKSSPASDQAAAPEDSASDANPGPASGAGAPAPSVQASDPATHRSKR